VRRPVCRHPPPPLSRPGIFGIFLNLFNLIPITPLDGGRIAAAISPWLWAVGIAVIGILLYLHFNFLLVLIAVLCAYRLLRMRRADPDAMGSYFAVSPRRRWTMCGLYFALMAALALGMYFTKVEL
jgi:Zn-dependent protease